MSRLARRAGLAVRCACAEQDATVIALENLDFVSSVGPRDRPLELHRLTAIGAERRGILIVERGMTAFEASNSQAVQKFRISPLAAR